jgi:hypothetical protein
LVSGVGTHAEIYRVSKRAAGREVTRVTRAHGVSPDDDGDDEDNKRDENGNQRRTMLD